MIKFWISKQLVEAGMTVLTLVAVAVITRVIIAIGEKPIERKKKK